MLSPNDTRFFYIFFFYKFLAFYLFDIGHKMRTQIPHLHLTIDKQGASEPIIIVQQVTLVTGFHSNK